MDFKKLALLLSLLYATPSSAIEPFVVKDIRVEGIQRTEAGTVFSYLPIKVGDTVDDNKSATAIRALFASPASNPPSHGRTTDLSRRCRHE